MRTFAINYTMVWQTVSNPLMVDSYCWSL